MGCTGSTALPSAGSSSHHKKKLQTMQKASSQRDIHNRWSHWNETFDPITGEELAPLPKKKAKSEHSKATKSRNSPNKRPTSIGSSSGLSSLSLSNFSGMSGSSPSVVSSHSSTSSRDGCSTPKKRSPRNCPNSPKAGIAAIAALELTRDFSTENNYHPTKAEKDAVAKIANTSSNTITSVSSTDSPRLPEAAEHLKRNDDEVAIEIHSAAC